jgi:pimeloyl-ACP methyl ester carboxylesterase
MRPTDGFVTTDDGARLYFETLGTGATTIVIPNGLYFLHDFAHLAERHTLIAFDLRNRGRSDAIDDAARLERGILNDVDDLDAVRRHFGLDRIDLIGHSYVGITVVLYAMAHPAQVGRVVQIGPMAPRAGAPYPAQLTNADATLNDVLARLGELEKERASTDPVAFCRKFWSVLSALYVADPADAHKITWSRCDVPNERAFMKYWIGSILPSIRNLTLTPEQLAATPTPVLTIHGRKDRSAAYGGGREWAMLLPNARLVTIDNAGHGPWIEDPGTVFGAIAAFLDGAWPASAEKVESMVS